MIKDIRFKDLRKYLEKDNNCEVLDAFDKLADAAMIFAPVAFGLQFMPLLELLDVKDRVVELGKTVVNFISSKHEPDYIERLKQLRTAYSLICYTSFFETLEEFLPVKIRKKLKLHFNKKAELVDAATKEISDCQERIEIDVHNDLPYTDHITSFSETQNQLLKLYQGISKKIIIIIKESEVISNESDEMYTLEQELIDKLPQKAVERYRAQYLYLVDTFSDFGFFAQGIEFGALQNATSKNSETLNLIANATKDIDVGLSKLYKIVNSMHFDYTAIQSQDIVNDLRTKYTSMIEQPIIDDKEISSTEEKIKLTFPKIKDAFIPQSYKCLRYDSKIKLEDEKTWKGIKIRNDLGCFFIRYLCSLDSIETPLIILGHPGSGKSLLTKVLSAQLMSNTYTAIRIPLREVNADSTIDLLVEDQIKKVTQLNLPQGGYGAFAKQFKEKPLLIILDGYDELLQAKGDVFASYLDKAMRFQQDQKDMNRPVRIVVTSRITLIDKAIVPLNSTVLRLLEFNEKQRSEWVKIWNCVNAEYFLSCTPVIKPFSLPEHNAKSKRKNSIIELAEQPLLLLMLALYDSEGNSLSELDNDLKRTALYNNLLRRFVRRERSRYVLGFNEKTQKEQNEIIDFEMKRLGVVAIGMFNRKKLYINTKELDNDLNVFESGRSDVEMVGRTLKDSESLLGGFFFIHQSTARDVSANSDNTDSTFEFLHNTFGEFLTADIILRFAIYEAQAISECRKRKFLEHELFKKLHSPDGLCKEWFTCLMFTPLFSRPVVLEMIQEHVVQTIEDNDIDTNEFYENFEIAVKSQLKMILSTLNFPKVMTTGHGVTNDIPILGFASIYTLNLIILSSVLCKNGFVFDEGEYGRHDATSSETKPWDKLTFLWRTWFSAENLTGLLTVFNARRDGNKIIIKCHDKFEANSPSQPIDIQLCVSYALSDILNVGLAGLQSTRFSKIVKLSDSEIAKLLKKENNDLYFAFMVISLRNLIHTDRSFDYNEDYIRNINEIVVEIINNVNPGAANAETLISFFEVTEICCERSLFYTSTKRLLIGYISELKNHVDSSEEILVLYSALSLSKKITLNNSIVLPDNRIVVHELGMDFPSIEFMRFSRSLISDSKINTNTMIKLFESINGLIDNTYIDLREKDYILRKTMSANNIRILTYTNPVLATKILLQLRLNNKNDKEIVEDVIEIILNEVKTNGFNYIADEAIINIIKISRLFSNQYLFNKVSIVLEKVIKKHPEYMAYILYARTDLFDALIEILPDSFFDDDMTFDYINHFVFENIDIYPTKKVMFSYIKLVRKLTESHSNTSNMPDKVDKHYLKTIEKKLLDHSEKQSFPNDLKNMTLEEINTLYWFACQRGNSVLCNRIRKMCSLN